MKEVKTALDRAKEHPYFREFLGEELFEEYVLNCGKQGCIYIYESDKYLISTAFDWKDSGKIETWANLDKKWKEFCNNPTKLNLYLTR